MTNNKTPQCSMQWFFLILIALWTFAAIILPIVAFCLTKNLLCLSGFSTLAPPLYILYRITTYLFPKDDRDYRLAEIKAKRGTEQHNIKPVL